MTLKPRSKWWVVGDLAVIAIGAALFMLVPMGPFMSLAWLVSMIVAVGFACSEICEWL